MNIKKYFNLKIIVGLIAVIIGYILMRFTEIKTGYPPQDLYKNPSLSEPAWLKFSAVSLIILGLIILIWGILEKIIKRMRKNTKILNIIVIIGLILFMAYSSVVVWLKCHPIQLQPYSISQTRLDEKNLDIASLKEFCITNNGNDFNLECEGKSIEMENLYLYPAKNATNKLEHLYLYDSDTYSTYSDSINSDVSINGGEYIKIWINRENLDIGSFEVLEYEIKHLEKPVSVNIEGTIKSVELCTQNSPCKFGLMIMLDDITYNKNYSEINSGIYRNEEYGFEISNLKEFKYYRESSGKFKYFDEDENGKDFTNPLEKPTHGIFISDSVDFDRPANYFHITIFKLDSIDSSMIEHIMVNAIHDCVIDDIKGINFRDAGDSGLTYAVVKNGYQYEIYFERNFSIDTAKEIISNFKFTD